METLPCLGELFFFFFFLSSMIFVTTLFFTGRVVSPTPTPLSSWRVVPALVTSYDIRGRAVGLSYAQPTRHVNKVENSDVKRTAGIISPSRLHLALVFSLIPAGEYCRLWVCPFLSVWLSTYIMKGGGTGEERGEGGGRVFRISPNKNLLSD